MKEQGFLDSRKKKLRVDITGVYINDSYEAEVIKLYCTFGVVGQKPVDLNYDTGSLGDISGETFQY